MTIITSYDKFAILPKRCCECNRLFVFESYNIIYKEKKGMYNDFSGWVAYKELIMCKRCKENEDDRTGTQRKIQL